MFTSQKLQIVHYLWNICCSKGDLHKFHIFTGKSRFCTSQLYLWRFSTKYKLTYTSSMVQRDAGTSGRCVVTEPIPNSALHVRLQNQRLKSRSSPEIEMYSHAFLLLGRNLLYELDHHFRHSMLRWPLPKILYAPIYQALYELPKASRWVWQLTRTASRLHVLCSWIGFSRRGTSMTDIDLK